MMFSLVGIYTQPLRGSTTETPPSGNGANTCDVIEMSHLLLHLQQQQPFQEGTFFLEHADEASCARCMNSNVGNAAAP